VQTEKLCIYAKDIIIVQGLATYS